MSMDKILDKIVKKIEQIEKMHDKESLLCEEVKDLIEEIRDDNLEDNNNNFDDEEEDNENLSDEDFENEELDEEDIDEDEDK